MTNVREAILKAAENVGDRLNKNGLVGFMEWLASDHPRVFVRLLERAMRDQPEKSEDAPPPKSVEELQQVLRERGLPGRIYTPAELAKKR